MTELTDWSMDLYGNELERIAATLAAAGHTMDLVTMHADEADAHRMLYTGLDVQQQVALNELRAAGVLP